LKQHRYQALTHTVLLVAALCVLLGGCGGPPDVTVLPAPDLLKRGIEQYEAKKYLSAVETLQSLVFNYPGESMIDTAQFYLASSYFSNEDYVMAAVEYNRLLVNYPASDFATRSQLMKAICYYEGTPKHRGLDQSDLEVAIKQFEDFIIDHPESEAVPDAQKYLNEARTRLAHKYYESGTVYVRLRDQRAARIYFQKVVDEYTDTEFAPLATFELARGYYEVKDWDQAHEKLQSFRIVFPDHELAARAAELSCKALYKGGVDAFEQDDFEKASSRLDRFLLVCDSDNDKSEEVREYLERIGDFPVADTQSEDAGSAQR